jgi:rare lipoprotein A
MTDDTRPSLEELRVNPAVLDGVVFTRSIQGDHVMQKRRAVRNALFLLAACATAQAAGLTESSARTSPGTRHAMSSRSPKVHHSGISGGIASVYSGGGTASGERMNPGALTAAHPSLPFGTKVRVTNNHTGRSVVVRINDRGPFVKGRVIDLSPAAARAIGVGGIAQVSLSTN